MPTIRASRRAKGTTGGERKREGGGIVIESPESKRKKKIEQDLRGPLNGTLLSRPDRLNKLSGSPFHPLFRTPHNRDFISAAERETILDRDQPAYVAIIPVNRSRFPFYRRLLPKPDLSRIRYPPLRLQPIDSTIIARHFRLVHAFLPVAQGHDQQTQIAATDLGPPRLLAKTEHAGFSIYSATSMWVSSMVYSSFLGITRKTRAKLYFYALPRTTLIKEYERTIARRC